MAGRRTPAMPKMADDGLPENPEFDVDEKVDEYESVEALVEQAAAEADRDEDAVEELGEADIEVERIEALRALAAAENEMATRVTFGELGASIFYVLSPTDAAGVNQHRAVGVEVAPGDVCPGIVSADHGHDVFDLTVFTPAGTLLVQRVEVTGLTLEVGVEQFGKALR